MTDSGQDVRHRLVEGAADLIGRRGLRASTVRDLAKHAQTPEGSTYHYFPGGKQQLAAAAVRLNGEQVCQVVGKGLEDGPIAGLRVFVAAVRMLITSTDFRGGCPVLAVAVEGPDGADIPPALSAAAEVFASWESMFARSLEREGINEAQARQLGTLVVGAIEGAVAMCRAKQCIDPLDNVAESVETLLRTVTATAR